MTIRDITSAKGIKKIEMKRKVYDSPCLLWDKDLKVEDGITYLPLYMAPLI